MSNPTADLTEWQSNATLPHVSPPYERAVSSEEAVALLLADNERLRGVIANLSAEAAASRDKLAHATATLGAIINAED